MDIIDYIALFRNLLYISETIAKNYIAKEAKDQAYPVIDNIISDIINLLNKYKEERYVISKDEQWRIQHLFYDHQRSLDKLIENIHLLKECSKCNQKYVATTTYFYPDKKSKSGLRPECKPCYSKAKKEYYQKKIRI